MNKWLNRGGRIGNRKERGMNYLLSSRSIKGKRERERGREKLTYYKKCRSAPRWLTPPAKAATSPSFKNTVPHTIAKIGEGVSGDGVDFRDVDIYGNTCFEME